MPVLSDQFKRYRTGALIRSELNLDIARVSLYLEIDREDEVSHLNTLRTCVPFKLSSICHLPRFL